MSRKQWRPILSDAQVQKLADLIGDLGQVMVASIVIPAFFDKGSFFVVVLSVLAATMCWASAIILLKGIKNE